MRSKKVTLQIPWPLWELLEQAAPELGYENANQLLMWSGFYSVAIGKPHNVTAPIARAPEDVQDMFIADLVAARASGATSRGSFFEHLLEDVVKRFNLPNGPDMVKAILADTIQNRPRKPKGAKKDG